MAGRPAFPSQEGNVPPVNNPETPVGLGLNPLFGTPTPQQLLAMQNLSRTPGTTPYVGFFGPGGGPMIGTGMGGAPPPVPQYFFTSNQPPLNAAAAVALASPARRPGGRPRNPPQAASAKRHCNCKNSRCLKLYCECFASGRYCDGCNCVGCCNNQANEGTRQAAVEAILDRNPNAFRPKIAGDLGEEGGAIGAARHNKGCNCKKSGCLKKYCECFQAGIFCSGNCKCVDCKNYEGSEARAAAVSPGMPPHLTLRDAAGVRENPHMSPPASLQRGVAIGGVARPGPGGSYGVGGSPPPTVGEPYHRPVVGSPMRPPPGMPMPPLFMQQFGPPIPAPSPQAPTLTIPRAQRAAALREALKEAVKPEVVEKVCQLLLISAGEAQREEAERDDEGDVQMAEEAPSTHLGDVSQDKDDGEWVPSAVYADQERRVLQEFRDSLQMLCRLVQGKSERKLRDAMANNALVAMLSQAAASTGMQPQLRPPVVQGGLGQGVSAGAAQGPSPVVTSQGGNLGNKDDPARIH